MIEERIVNRIYKTQERILKELGEVLREIKQLRPSEIYRMKQLLKYGVKKDEILKVVADSMDKSLYDTAQYLDEYARETKNNNPISPNVGNSNPFKEKYVCIKSTFVPTK